MAVFQVAVVKGGDLIEVDTDKLDEKVYAYVVQMGLKHFVNAKMTKVTKASLPDDDERKAEAMKIAQENVENMYSGTVRSPVGAKAAKGKSGGRGKVQTLARQYARVAVKEEAKRLGMKVSHIEAKEITRLANLLLDHPEQGPMFIKRAENDLAALEHQGSLADLGITIAISERKVKQAEGKSERAKASGLSANQAGVPEAHVIAAAQKGPQQTVRR